MRMAQQLYEQGLISYMRTDATHLSQDAETSLKKSVVTSYGEDMYERRDGASSKRKKESKFAQEAHEAIRPAIQPDGEFLNPNAVELQGVAKDLYRMIFQRTLACRMPNLVTNLTQISIEATVSDGLSGTFRTSGSVVLSPGYTSAYGTVSGQDDPEKRELPALIEGEQVDSAKVESMPHETQPPPRYTEASFVKELEALGVGRPSTYAGIITLLRERAYVGSPVASQANVSKKDVSGPAISAHRAAGGDLFTGASKGPLVPSLPAFAVCSLLEKHCPTYVDSKFTARMEERLDSIANSEQSSEEERLLYLNEFYAGDEGLAAVVKRIGESNEGEEFRRVRLPALESNEAVTAPNLDEDEDIRLLVGPWGPYIQRVGMNGDETVTAPLPSSMAADLSTITAHNLRSILSTKETGGYLLGVHPEDGRSVRLKTGRFGAYLQRGDDGEPDTTTHSLPLNLPVVTPDSEGGDVNIDSDYPANMPFLTFDDALGYASLPKTISELHDNPIVAAVGPYGPYLKYNNTYVNLEKDQNILSIDAETAESLVAEALASGGRKKPRGTLAELGEKEGGMVRIKSGRFVNYISWKKTNAKLPDTYIDSFPPLEEAFKLICDKRTKPPVQTRKRAEKKGIKAGQDSSVKLPPQPKRPLSAYLLFSMANRPKLAEQKLSLGESSKVLSKMWADLSLEEKSQYDADAIKNKSKYEEEKKIWQGDCQRMLEGATRTSTKMKSLKDSNQAAANSSKRKRRKSAYVFFCQKHRPDVASKVTSLGEISKELARLWRETTDRSKYEDLAAGDEIRCEEEDSEITDSPSPNTRTPKQTRPGQQKRAKRSPSAYMLFCKEFRPTIVDADGNKLPLGETTKRLAVLWKSCDTATRERFDQLALEGKENAFIVA
jgi:topoisomerase IA-like protein